MALKALDIYKHLPKSNCAKCGSPTCLAFAMQLASKKVDLDQCPVITPEGRAALDEASSPPIRLVTIGKGDGAVKVGNETVLFRHDETFYHPTGVAVRLKDDASDEAIVAKIQAIEALKFERVGQKISVDMIAIEYASGDPEKYARTAVSACQTGLAPILMAKDLPAMSAAVIACADYKPLLYRADESNWREMADMACKCRCPLVVDASDLEKASQLTQQLIGVGVEDLILDVTSDGFGATLQALTKVRRLALRKNFRPLGFPSMAIPTSLDEDVAVVEASSYIAKYAEIVVVDTSKPQHVLPMLTVRMNIYTDPRKPVQVEPKVYSIGAVTSDSPLIITTNFSLTYYTVEGDVEASRIPCYIGVIDTEGTSVLTAWASEKLTVEKVVKLLNSEEVTSKINHKKVIVPGYVAVMSGKLTDESGWQVLVGPRESSGIPKFLKTMWKNA